MRYGIYSDLHANLEALKVVLQKLTVEEKVDCLICLGDVVGYGANPNECIDLVKDKTKHVIAGNHDHAALDLTDIRYFNPYAKKAVHWTQEQLTQESHDYLHSLPLSLHFEEEDFMIVHATPSKPEAWNYIFSRQEARYEFNSFTEKVCFIGHSHQPLIIESENNEINVIQAHEGTDVVQLKEDCRYIINDGSVGQPRDRNPKSAYCIFDSDKMTVQIKRTGYDVEKAQKKIIDAGLPELLADRLATGD